MRLFDVADRVAPALPPAVRVNGKEISRADIAREIQNHPAENPSDAREAAVRALVVRELLIQAAGERALLPEPADLGEGQYETHEDALVRQLLDLELQMPTPTEDDCERFYKKNVRRFRSPTIWEPAHILISATCDDLSARRLAQAKAGEIAKLLREKPESFEQLARDHSMCPSREQGGNLGQISRGQTTPAFEAALERMTPGTISNEPVGTPYGFHIIRLDRCIPGQTLPFQAVKEKISDYLACAVFHRAVSQFVALLAGSAQIDGIQLDCALSPLVQ
ncbi:MAG: peptidylprolyl isomerase [Hyphomicrobiaceae bacterium]